MRKLNAPAPLRSAFATALVAWRARAGVSQRALDDALGHTHGTTGQTECGRYPPPNKEVCARIADILGVSRTEVWRVAMDDRLRRFDPELHAEMRKLIPPGGDQVQEELQRIVAALDAVHRDAFRGVDAAITARRAAILEIARLVAHLDGIEVAIRDSVVEAILTQLREPPEAP